MTLYNGHFKFQNFNVAYACILWVPAQTIDRERLVSQTRSTHQIPIICLQLYGSYRLRSILIYGYRESRKKRKKIKC